ncbi:uncharacterized protein LOC110451456 [Mizuhopecten yessoensis]|uniref:uncharacterized protein LOC110451456 n=1 Tax=Mizuhopecten yessoensis TaxID=6573 RepID=UPI000B45838D|nr:uncharacterized protein LOC110451456 [Mizuhopecten yessoensis]XP_021355162.1 uncharacterized protein LOC110451456 [Mizuhopecten yessoensis]XP_021355163.1 uncharacterized protein LOC110451456 [Mizuhopecten yessoensis]
MNLSKGTTKVKFVSNDDLSVGNVASVSTTTNNGPDKRMSKSLHDVRAGTMEEKTNWVDEKRPPLPPGSANQVEKSGATTVGPGGGVKWSKDGSNSGKSIKGGSRDLESTEEEVVICYQDEAVTVGETGAGNSVKTEEPPRLMVVSSKIRNSMALRHAILPNVIFVQYKFDSASLEGILNLVTTTLNSRKVSSIALILSCVGSSIHVSGKDEKVITKETISESQPIRDFFTNLVGDHLDKTTDELRLDLLACNAVQHGDSSTITKEIETLIQHPVTMSRDLVGADHNNTLAKSTDAKVTCVGEFYFKVEKLRGWSGQQQQSLAGFEKIQTVGKGAYGVAVLYKKKDDESLVILKEINMHDLNAAERQLALNEVNILAFLDHPNIISYYDSFEEDGVLMIEIEYADGGTLAQFLAQQDKPLEEKTILTMFQQIVAAIRHIHEHNVLHRDLKTANIFLTKEGVVKVGDFGISKMMSSANKGANTVLGTPYYISPEMCEGKPYNDKSDIWALGCILYEMACLQKTFEGSNLPALVNKIMKGQFAPVKDIYSAGFKELIMDMLRQDPGPRPSAHELMYTRLPELMNSFEDPTTDCDDDLLHSHESNAKTKKKTRSLFFYFESSSASITPIELPPKIKIRHAAAGEDHVIVVTTERQVFTWGEGGKGQLGHGNTESLTKPTLVEALTGKSITRGSCGAGFSIFASDNGIILTCGDGTKGCLGHGDWTSTYRPRLIESLLSVDVISVACGPKHVVVVGSDGEIFSWGCGGDGRLGLGNEDNQCQPTEVNIVEPVVVREVRCGVDGTMFRTDVGGVFACGSNLDNKLGLNHRQGFIMAMKNLFIKTEVEGLKEPTPVRALARHKVLDITMGLHHTAVIVEPGHVFTFGRNTEGQLGISNTKDASAPVQVKSMADSVINRVQCGDHYTAASTINNELYYWGLRFKVPSSQTSVVKDNDSCSSINGSIINKDDIRLESVTPREATRDDVAMESVTPRKGSASHSRQASITSISSLASTRESGQLSSHDGTVGSSITDEGCQDNLDKLKTDGSLDNVKIGSTHKRQESVDSAFSQGLTDSGIPSSLPNTPSDTSSLTRPGGFRPLSSVPRRTSSASSGRENSKDKDKDKEKDKDKDTEVNKDESEIIYPPMHLMKISKSGDESLTISSFFCHGENLFVQLETSAPPPRRKSRKKRGIRKRFSGNTLNVPKDTALLYSASSREGGDEYSSEASEMDTQGTVPRWLKEELANSEREINDGNEADDTSDQSDDELSRKMIDSSMSSIQINKDLNPAKNLETVSPRVKQKKPITEDLEKTMPETPEQSRDRSTSANSTESEVDFPSGSIHSDSSKENVPGHRRKLSDSSNFIKRNIQVTSRKSSAPIGNRNRLPPGPQKPLSRLRGQPQNQGQEAMLKEQLAARGFVSDVTVKRRQEALQHELEITREEKQRAEEKIQKLEMEHRHKEALLRQEAELHVLKREKNLEEQIELLKTELRNQNSQLKDNQRMVLSLRDELTKVQTGSGSGQSSRSQSGGKESRVCTVQ